MIASAPFRWLKLQQANMHHGRKTATQNLVLRGRVYDVLSMSLVRFVYALINGTIYDDKFLQSSFWLNVQCIGQLK